MRNTRARGLAWCFAGGAPPVLRVVGAAAAVHVVGGCAIFRAVGGNDAECLGQLRIASDDLHKPLFLIAPIPAAIIATDFNRRQWVVFGAHVRG